jgi:hypothetical protein
MPQRLTVLSLEARELLARELRAVPVHDRISGADQTAPANGDTAALLASATAAVRRAVLLMSQDEARLVTTVWLDLTEQANAYESIRRLILELRREGG